MSDSPVLHGSFTLQRTYRAPRMRVFAAWADVDAKARWFTGPPDKWTVLQRDLDFRVGGAEFVLGQLENGPDTLYRARYHVIDPPRRLVYAYDMTVGDKHLSTSLATVQLASHDGVGTVLTYTEQAAFLDSEEGTTSREAGTASHLARLDVVLGDPHEIVSARVLDASPDRVFHAFSDPVQLARWWGPKGFTNTFQEFDPRSGGAWRFVMHGPDGTDYHLAKDFVEVVAPKRVVLRHAHPTHRFSMTMTFSDMGAKTYLAWRLRFESAEEAESARTTIMEANEQNFDRLAAHLATTQGH